MAFMRFIITLIVTFSIFCIKNNQYCYNEPTLAETSLLTFTSSLRTGKTLLIQDLIGEPDPFN